MKNNRKTGTAVLAAFILLLCGCRGIKRIENSFSREELPMVTICTVNSTSQEANRRISEAVSRITREKLGCNVRLSGFSMDGYEQEISYLYVSGKMPDAFAAFELTNLERLIDKGAVIPIEELIKPYKEGLDRYIFEKEWMVSTLDGHLYGIPSSITEDKCMGFVFRRDLCEELGIDWRSVRSLDGLHDMLVQVKQAYPGMDMIASHNGKIIPNIGQDRLNNNMGVLMERGQEDLTVENLYATQFFADLCKRMRSWEEEGLFMDRAYARMENRQNYIAADRAFGSFLNMSEVSLYNVGRHVQYKVAAVQLAPRVRDSDSCNMVWCISRDCRNPELTMKVLDLMFTDAEVSKLLSYGEEGIDYTQVDDRFVTQCEDSPLAKSGVWRSAEWAWPVGVPIERWMVDGEDLLQYTAFWDEPVIESAAMGFLFDASEVRTEVDACQAVINKYENALLCGALEPDTAIPGFLEELEAVGIDKVIREKQEQLVRWKKAVGY